MANLGSAIVYGVLKITGLLDTKELKVNGHKVSVGDTEPSSPSVGDIWIDTSS